MRLFVILLISVNVYSAPYDWQANPMLNGNKQYNALYTTITEPNPYGKGQRTKDNKGNVWITEKNPYNPKELRTRQIHGDN